MNSSPITITAASRYALTLLSQSPYWTLHSSYRKTVNITDGCNLIALQTAGSPISPLSLITNHSNLTDLFVYNQQYACEIFSYTASIIYDDILSPLPALKTEAVKNLLAAMAQTIQTSDTQSFDLLFKVVNSHSPSTYIANDLLLNAANAIIIETESCFSQAIPNAEAWQKSAAQLSTLIGIGIGLTPSGDDFLTGVLAGFILINKPNHPFCQQLKKAISQQLHRTNEISAAFIKCALNGRFSQHICQLKAFSPVSQILADFTRVGHSSGIDTLCGIYWTLRHFA